MRPSAAVVLLVLLSVVPAAAGGDVPTESGDTQSVAAVESEAVASVLAADATRTRAASVAPQIGETPTALSITVAANGSARWQFRYRVPLENDTQREDFRAFAERFESEETELFRGFTTRASALTREASNVTGREMNATGFEREAYVDPSPMRDFGVVTLSFRWTGFAEVSEERLVVADVFEGGFYLGPGQRLVVRPGSDLAFQSVTPEATQSDPDSLRASDSVTWTGERRFTDNRPRIVFVPARTAPTTTDSGVGDGGVGSLDSNSGASGGPTTLVGFLLVVAGLGAIALLVARRRGLTVFEGDRPTLDARSGTSGDGASEVTEEPNASVEDAVEGATDGATAVGASETGDADTAVSDADLQSDEDRVLSMLDANGGQMRQSRIVQETGWSKSKVSMLLSEMDQEDLISKLRLGRENVVSLPDSDPTTDDEDGS